MEKPVTTPDLALLRSALSRCTSASQWASQAKLINVSGELNKASNEIRDYLLSCPTKVKNVETA